MGEAKRKKKALGCWLESLSDNEKLIADTALRLLHNFVRPAQATGMCYRLTFMLKALLKDLYNIDADAVVGWIDDGDGLAISHAWLEYNGKKIDLSLGNVDAMVATSGDVLVLDQVIQNGSGKFTYYRQLTDNHSKMLNELANSNAEFRRVLKFKEDEHSRMNAISRDGTSILQFLDGAPDGISFSRVKEIVRSYPTFLK